MYRLLMIDDEKPVRTVLAAFIKKSGLPVVVAESVCNGRDGLTALRETRPDIVLADIQMPVMNGIELMKQANREGIQTRFIVVSGYDHFEYAQSAIKAGAVDYLLKPVVFAEFCDALRRAIHLIENETGSSPEPMLSVSLSPQEIVTIIKNQVDQKYAEPIHISMFSERYHFSKEYLSKLFKKEYGCGIYEYALKRRMERAREMLMDPHMQVKEISNRLGYSNNNYFSKAFKNYYGVAPSEFRKTMEKTPEGE